MHHVCRKLQLKAGERVVEAGGGWGGFALFMAKNYGVRVRSFNISKEQIAHSRDWAKQLGLDGQVEFVEDDYRNLTGHVRRVRLDRHARARRQGQLQGSRRADESRVDARRPRPRAQHRPRYPGADERVDRQAHLPGRLPSDPARDDGHVRAEQAVRARRREHPPALREDARMVAAALRGERRGRARHVRRDVRARVAACISSARSRRSSPASCSCSRCCLRAAAPRTFRGRARMSTAITPESYAEKTARLTSNWQSGSGPLRLEKSTISNLFRYQPRGAAARRLSLGEFNHVLALDRGGTHGRGRRAHDLRDRRALLPRARFPAARRTRAQAHHGRRRDGRHRHRVDLLPLRVRARRAARGGRAVAGRHDRHGARRQRARGPVRRAAEFLRHARLHPAREDRAASRKPLRARARARNSATPPSISRRCALRRNRPTSSSSKDCSSRTTATS